jgi:hypothetical protein
MLDSNSAAPTAVGGVVSSEAWTIVDVRNVETAQKLEARLVDLSFGPAAVSLLLQRCRSQGRLGACGSRVSR